MTRERWPRGQRTWHQEAEVWNVGPSSFQLLYLVTAALLTAEAQLAILTRSMMTTKDSEAKFVADDKHPLVRSH